MDKFEEYFRKQQNVFQGRSLEASSALKDLVVRVKLWRFFSVKQHCSVWLSVCPSAYQASHTLWRFDLKTDTLLDCDSINIKSSSRFRRKPAKNIPLPDHNKCPLCVIDKLVHMCFQHIHEKGTSCI